MVDVGKRFGGALLAALLTAAVAGCGGNNAAGPSAGEGASGGAGGTKKPETAKPLADPNQPVELYVVSTSGDSEESWNERFGAIIQKQFPKWTVKYVKSTKEYGVKEMIAANAPMDLYFDSIAFMMNGLIGSNLQTDMTDLIKLAQIDLARFEPSLVHAMKQLAGGKMYGVPVFNNNVVLYYNKDIYNKFGASYPKDGMTWDEFTESVKTFNRSDGDKQYVGYNFSGTHMLRMNQMSLPYVDEKTGKSAINGEGWKTFNETAFIAPMVAGGYKEFFAKYNKGPYTPEFFQTQQSATFALLSSSMLIDKGFETLNWDLVALPTFKELPGVGSQGYPTYFSVTSNSRHKNEAMEVINYLVSEEA
ncbi:ABC transporter substrate-binding protein [Paenibacillus sp. GYB003]|uniref:ABC transporter substrate-binding protein n=1 Tax=Paenibacillus sp. GYB003 TaxID=2994392 RepID=UPI002F964022